MGSYSSYVDDLSETERSKWDHSENVTFILILVFWTSYLFFVVVYKRMRKHPWKYVFDRDYIENFFELNDPFDYFDLVNAKKRLKKAEIQKERYHWSSFCINALGGAARHPTSVERQFTKATTNLQGLQELRGKLDLKKD